MGLGFGTNKTGSLHAGGVLGRTNLPRTHEDQAEYVQGSLQKGATGLTQIAQTQHSMSSALRGKRT